MSYVLDFASIFCHEIWIFSSWTNTLSRVRVLSFLNTLFSPCIVNSFSSFYTPSSNSSYSRQAIHLFISVHTRAHTQMDFLICVYLFTCGIAYRSQKTISFISHWRRTADKRLRLDSTWRNPFDRSLEGVKRVWMKFHCHFVKNDAATPTAAEAARQPNWRRRHNRRCLHKNSYTYVYICTCMSVRFSYYIHTCM